MAIEQPSGTVTLVFTDIEGSTRLLEELGVEGYKDALAEHRRIVREACARHDGYEVDYEGDAFFYAFATAQAAVTAVSESMTGLAAGPIRIRVGIHTGEPALDPPKYVGLDVHRAARIMSSAHGGQVVLSPSTVALLDPSSVELRDLGRHRLKDLSAPIPLHQLTVDGEAQDFPPLKTLYRSNLPVPATPFLGREAELAEVLARLIAPETRVLTLTGPGGTGKTRLALQAAADASDHHPDGIVWIPLAPLREPGLVLLATADALGVKPESGAPLLETLAVGLEGKRPLLVIDNAEHLLPELAGDLAALVHALPGARLLVTSRERLQLTGERVYAVPGLEEEEAVSLFRERAAALDAPVEEGPAVARLCARLDHLPLAIELAAARAPLFDPKQLLRRLDERLDLLRGARDADPRQQTLRATISWSYELLDRREQALLRRLGAFVGGCTYDAAEEIAGADPDLLQSLLDKSLLRRRDGQLGPRYWMLETILDYAREELERAGDLADLAERHDDFYGRVVERWSSELMGPRQHLALGALDEDEPNWRAAFQRRLDADAPEVAAEMAARLAVYWWFRGDAEEWLPVLLGLVERGIADPRLRAEVLRGAVELAAQLDLREVERHCLDESLHLFEELGDVDGVAYSWANLTWWAIRKGDAEAAGDYATRALAHIQHSTREWTRTFVLHVAASAAQERGMTAEARSLFQEALASARASENPRWLAMTLGGLGWLELQSTNYVDARRFFVESRSTNHPADRELMATVESNLGLCNLFSDEHEVAAAHFRAALETAPPGSRLIRAEALFGVAALAAPAAPETALRLWSSARSVLERADSPLGQVLERVERVYLEQLRSSIAPDAFARLWDEGTALTLPRAVELAGEIALGLEQPERDPSVASTSSGRASSG